MLTSGKPGRAALCCLVVLAFGCVASAQSGRRGTKSSAAAVEAAAQPSPTPAKAEAAKEPAAKIKLVVGGSLPRGATDRAAVIYNNFVMTLTASPLVEVASVGALTRAAAVARARGEAETYVVLVEMTKDSFQNGSVMINSQDLKVSFTAFEPVTGKAKGKGKLYYQAMGGGGNRSAGGVGDTPVKITPEAAGEELAEMVLAWLARPENRPAKPPAGPAPKN